MHITLTTFDLTDILEDLNSLNCFVSRLLWALDLTKADVTVGWDETQEDVYFEIASPAFLDEASGMNTEIFYLKEAAKLVARRAAFCAGWPSESVNDVCVSDTFKPNTAGVLEDCFTALVQAYNFASDKSGTGPRASKIFARSTCCERLSDTYHVRLVSACDLTTPLVQFNACEVL